MKPNRYPILAIAFCGLVTAAPAHAASMQKVNQSDWWAGVSGLPSYVNMYIYVPDKVATTPPIVVAPHHCGGTASSTYSEMSSLVSIANTNGFIMVIPEATGQNCWDVGSSRSLKHDGKGDTHAVAQMVRYTLTKYKGDTSRVYAVGGSSGGMMTEALLGVYPDIFIAGVSLMGVPCGCWAEGYNDVVGKPSNGTGQWSGACAGGNVTKTAAQWGALVRSYFSEYTGHRPRLQHWHGTSDTTISFKNLAEDAKEWTNLLGLSETPTGTDTPKSGTTRQYWKNSCGYVVYETFALSGVAHSVPFDGNAVATYFGLNKVGGADPETAACGAGTGGSSSVGGASGTSTGGTTTTGGTGATTTTGGTGATTAHTGGSSSSTNPHGETGGTGSSSTLNGGSTSGPVGVGGNVAASGGTNAGVASGTGTSKVINGTQTTSGGNPSALGGAGQGVGGQSGNTVSTSSSTGADADDSSSGCNCIVSHRSAGSFPKTAALLLGAIGLLLRRKHTPTKTPR
jgi:poly(hydroxyalkanoate) depolymerase family esterase